VEIKERGIKDNRRRYRPDAKSPKFLDNNIVNGNLVEQCRDFIEILRDFLLSSGLKNHRGHRVHRESCIALCSLGALWLKNIATIPYSRKNLNVLEFLHDKRIKPFLGKNNMKKFGWCDHAFCFPTKY